MKVEGVCEFFEYLTIVHNSTVLTVNKGLINRQKKYWYSTGGGPSWPSTNLTSGTYFGTFQ